MGLLGHLFLYFGVSFANQCVDLFAPPKIIIETSQVRPLTADNTEVFRRNNNIGIQQNGSIRLEKWIELKPYPEDSYNFVGITRDGRIYHLIDWHGERRIARLLGGQKTFKDLFVVNDSILGAIDFQGRVYFYSPARWAQSPRRETVKRGLKIWSGITFIVTSGLYLIHPEAVHWNINAIPLPPVFIALASGLQTGLVILNRYDHFNTFPDGFIKTQMVVTKPADVAPLMSQLSTDFIDKLIVREDFAVPAREQMAPAIPAAATEDIR